VDPNPAFRLRCGCRCASTSRRRFTLALVAGAALPAWAREGVDVGKTSALSKLVPAADVEQAAAQQYAELLQQAARQGKLAGSGNPQLGRLRKIAERLIPFTYEWNERARQWKWQINLIESPEINAFCMPGGKIAFYSGIIDKLKLTDAEIAMVMGHEMAHALREHAREQMGKGFATRGAIQLGAALLGLGDTGRMVANMGGQLLTLQFSRQDESEADLVGLELAARAGYDPHAGVSLWRKMEAASRGSSLPFLSTHPSGPARIREIEANIPKVEPLYERAAKPR
jgi:Zn-dependent protease with chaperone function